MRFLRGKKFFFKFCSESLVGKSVFRSHPQGAGNISGALSRQTRRCEGAAVADFDLSDEQRRRLVGQERN